MPDAVTFLVPLQVIYFFLSGRSQYLFLISSALRFLDGVSCSELLFVYCDGPFSIWKLLPSVLEYILEDYFFKNSSCIFFLFDNFCHSYIKLPEQNSHFLCCLHFSSFFFNCHFLSFCKNFFKFISLLSKTLILSSLLYFKIPTQLFFVVVPFIQQLILASWMQYLSSFFHSLFPQSYFSSLFVSVYFSVKSSLEV